MPRPKKLGAPEPKKRTRNGCWPCKTRKVKCDEARPTCVNCQKQNQTCDYSIRLNWEGRSKKRSDGSPGLGQITFSSGPTSAGTSGENAGNATTDPTEWQNEFQIQSAFPLPQFGTSEVEPEESSDTSHANQLEVEQAQDLPTSFDESVSDMSMIDPAIMRSVSSPPQIYQDSMYGSIQVRPDHQYTQSYERYRSLTPGTPLSVQAPAISRIRQTMTLDESPSSPSDSDRRSPVPNTFSSRSVTMTNMDSQGSTPPFFSSGKDDAELAAAEIFGFERPTKRARHELSAQDMGSPYDPTMPPPSLMSFQSYNIDSQGFTSSIATPGSSGRAPLTPGSSHSDEYFKSYSNKVSPLAAQECPDLRRLSVSSLLSGPPGIPSQSDRTYYGGSDPEVRDWSLQMQDVYQDTTTWGIDRGFKDLDIGKNDDMNAISGSSPSAMRDHLELVLDEDGEFMLEFGFGMQSDYTAFDKSDYYDKPVAICIPRILEPLPSKLLENPMNLLYFHHFLNHTAGCLIPHKCSSNPFKSILPQMAVQDDNLLNLLLAYSASHRARLLRQPEPATRIALWVQDIFPNLRHALDDPSKVISNSNLATAIMLASLEIISPKAFGVAVPWQKHLDTARRMIAARGGPQSMQTSSRRDKVTSFLWSWFAYLDVLGSLSGVQANGSASSWVLDFEIDEENDYQIDCILGFTSRCVNVLAKIAELARICDSQRISPDLTIQSDWQPSQEIAIRAEKIEADLATSRLHPAKPCTHMQSTGEAAYQSDSIEMSATNEAFHWAGAVHLHRRILGKSSAHKDVQVAVCEIFQALHKVKRGGSAEACLLFPMFTAGCDTQDERQRSDILERIKGVERFGMTQVHKARTLMERVWETGKPWETLVAGEFFG